MNDKCVPRIVHVIQQVSHGGASRAMVALAKYSARQENFEHVAMFLRSSPKSAVKQAKQVGIDVIQFSRKELANADIVHVHYWNNPEIFEFLKSELPPMRMVIWFHVAGDSAPHVITEAMVNTADIPLATSPYGFDLPVFQKTRLDGTASLVFGAPDFARLAASKRKLRNSEFTVGYLGTVDFIKMHPNFVEMCSKINIPNVKFIVCGDGGAFAELRRQARRKGILNRFLFRGYTEDISAVFASMDVFGYPLCSETYASSECVLQEGMFCGVPPVILASGGAQRMVHHNLTGLVAENELEYKNSIEFLYQNPSEMDRIADCARRYAAEHYGAENAAKKINPIYTRLMNSPKSTRRWGAGNDELILNRKIGVDDLTRTKFVGAESFVESLGRKCSEFPTSLFGNERATVLCADRNIMESSRMLRSPGSGGLIAYQRFYPDDGFLRFWFGLTLISEGKFRKAIEQFSLALQLGCENWRVRWNLAATFSKIHQFDAAMSELNAVLSVQPDFQEAKNLRKSIAARRGGVSEASFESRLGGNPSRCSTGDELCEIHLITQYFIPKDRTRTNEVDNCLIRNLDNPFIHRCYLLTETDLDSEVKQRFAPFEDKLEVVNIGKRLSYKAAFEYANQNLAGRICLVSNADIYFDSTLEKLTEIDLDNRMLALLRYEFDKSDSPRLFTMPGTQLPRPDSQDTWVFRAPIKINLSSANFELGRGGCDNRIAQVAIDSGMKLSNPCFEIKSYHLHESRTRRIWESSEVVGPYAFLHPCRLLEMDETRQILNLKQYKRFVRLHRKNTGRRRKR